ncbi:uncharacterized protein DNG_04595 [Cephalotrichum gorgonifer]|uniref:Hemerythrin-like domain-containing protein n=1 Tax=Cephalotrichum gorgonifer TaxID=2041049 RepID=A0AAE8SVE3_9PEZI|nr:uncharacterized protein DNG_04595 [Cephalotrichum gorgonifer]
MAPIYADHPFQLCESIRFRNGKAGDADQFDRAASEMSVVHNLVIRGLNAIYLQAPHIQPSDEKSFCTFITLWHVFIHHHHSEEEESFFPAVEKMAGEKGIMDVNVSQHHEFHDGLDSLAKYAADCVSGEDEYDGARVTRIIDGFGAVLVQHLAEELPCLRDLRRFGEEKMADLDKLFEEQGDKVKTWLSLPDMAVILSMHDTQYEDGLWANWPPIPAPVKLLITHAVGPMARSQALKFGPVDKSGKMRPLYAIPKNT